MTHVAKGCQAALCLVLISGCAQDAGDGASFGDALADPQLPARGSTDLPQWLAASHYLAWHCEPARHAARSPSPHGTTRICNNDALAASRGTHPIGAAAVKEIFDGDRVVGHAVSRKLTADNGGRGWYWYEGTADTVYANGEGAGSCTGCHAQAARDFVFTIVP